MTAEQEPARDNRQADPERRDVTVRRAPRFVPFVLIWAVLGVVAAAISAYTGPENPDFTRGTIFAFLAVLFALAGILIGSLLFLVIDRISVKRAKPATAVAEPGQEATEGSVADAGATTAPGHDEPAAAENHEAGPGESTPQHGSAGTSGDQDGESEGERRT
ncbi:tripartite tricarboxylate transporter TctB family protein [Arthrobacter sp. CAU 1506]|uniref:tripartite tricarboxylate transporter TctB family protein n=1 Tax=Arthrobacter sp. CAU 1506 TaxID=2560052 RepID=UPI00197AD481|nr:tripartite tricarboxylate transporter TctB family protein [Arthrobacter sp. CAU 1506]